MNVVNKVMSGLLIDVIVLNASVINVVSTQSINAILVLIYVLMYTHNKYPGCYNSDALHEQTPMSASQWPTQKPYKNCFIFQKECGQRYNFCREADKVGRTHCVCTAHPRSTIFGTHNLTMPIVNNIKKCFE